MHTPPYESEIEKKKEETKKLLLTHRRNIFYILSDEYLSSVKTTQPIDIKEKVEKLANSLTKVEWIEIFESKKILEDIFNGVPGIPPRKDWDPDWAEPVMTRPSIGPSENIKKLFKDRLLTTVFSPITINTQGSSSRASSITAAPQSTLYSPPKETQSKEIQSIEQLCNMIKILVNRFGPTNTEKLVVKLLSEQIIQGLLLKDVPEKLEEHVQNINKTIQDNFNSTPAIKQRLLQQFENSIKNNPVLLDCFNRCNNCKEKIIRWGQVLNLT